MNTEPDFVTMRGIFLKFLEDGMTHAEAERMFDKDELRAATEAEFRDDLVATRDDENSLWNLVVKAGWDRSNEAAMEQAVELWAAGWTSEIPESHRHNSKDFWRQCHTMSLYWRAPSKRPPRPGKRYLSTNQAWMAMKRTAA